MTLFLRPWEPVCGDRAKYFEKELARELAPHHPLFGRPVHAIALTVESDDVLYQLDDGSVSQVHLTYTPNAPEAASGCPRHRSYGMFGDWVIEKMLPDHIDHFGLWNECW
jgi:hypothetical protein